MTVMDEHPGNEHRLDDAGGRVAELHEIRAGAEAGPSEKATEAQHAKGKLDPRERIELLLDPGSFHEVERLRRASGHWIWPGDEEAVHRWSRHRLGHG